MSFLNKKSGVVRRVAAVAILGIGLTACGGDDADEPAEEEAATEEVAEEPAAEEPAAAEPTGDPIKLMTVTTLNANGPTYENIIKRRPVFVKRIICNSADLANI